MKPGHWQRIEEFDHLPRQREPSQRTAFLMRACTWKWNRRWRTRGRRIASLKHLTCGLQGGWVSVLCVTHHFPEETWKAEQRMGTDRFFEKAGREVLMRYAQGANASYDCDYDCDDYD